ncbi:hypothetical protein ABZX72_29385 [Streptomyces cyaneofuscatus]|uniref:hypothetical protein n=1 Tax=Streptomyces cyaneofuscatus TaxID=66883 RepID=UPI0033A91ADB
MTTAPAAHRPSPADLATPAAKARAERRMADLIAPANIGPWRFRPAYTLAIRQSGMSPHPRLVALVLAIHAHGETGIISDAKQPGLNGLAKDTGLTVGQVVVALRVLESRGWVSITRTSAHGASARATVVQPHIPEHATAVLRAITASRPERTNADA